MVLKAGVGAIAIAAISLAAAAAVAQGGPTSLSPGQILKGAIRHDTPKTADRSGRFDCYALSGSAGASLAIRVSSTAFSPRLSVGRGATCAAATFQYVQSGAADGKDVSIVFRPAPGRYMVMVQAPDGAFGAYALTSETRGAVQMAEAGVAATGPSRREIMEAQVGKRRAELAAEDARRQEEAQRQELARLEAEASAAAEAERQAAEAAYEEDDEEPAAPAANPLAAFSNAFNQAMQQNEADRQKQQQFLDGIAEQQREAQRARAQAERERAQLASRQAAERAEQARQMAAANTAQRQAAAQALAQRQQQQAAEQAQRQEQQRQIALQQQRAQQLAQQQRAPAPSSSTQRRITTGDGPPVLASTQDDPMRCVTRPSVSPGALCKGALNVSAVNGCGQPVDIRLCLKKEGRWECGTGWGIRPQQSFSFPVCNATSEAFMGARSSSGGGPMPSPR